jgi:hypothetical protein
MNAQMEKIDVLFEHFLWWELHQDEINSERMNKYDWIDELKREFYKECLSIYIINPDLFRELTATTEFSEQVHLYGLTTYVQQILQSP